MKKIFAAALAAVPVVLAASPALAAPKTISGEKNGLSWTAASKIVGQTSTGTVASGGNPLYLAPNSAGYSGVVGILMTYKSGAQFVCSGSLVNSTSVVTAAHCVSDGGGKKSSDLVRTQVIFQNNASSAADAAIYSLPAGTTSIDTSYIAVNSKYTGEVIDQNDIAVLRLSQAAPAFAQRYGIDFSGGLVGSTYNVAGYGTRSIVGGAEGTTGPGAGAGVGRRRQGDNRFDFTWGDAAFDGFFTDRDANGENFWGTAEVAGSILSDFDNGLEQNDASCALGAAFGVSTAQFCNLGLGVREVATAGGDSGGPQFINGKLVAVTSYGVIFGGRNLGADFKEGLNNSWGEFSGYVPVALHQQFIAGAIPEPATWMQMIAGFGIIGGAVRTAGRRSRKLAAA